MCCQYTICINIKPLRYINTNLWKVNLLTFCIKNFFYIEKEKIKIYFLSYFIHMDILFKRVP